MLQFSRYLPQTIVHPVCPELRKSSPPAKPVSPSKSLPTITFFSCISSSLRPKFTTPYWPQDMGVLFFFRPPPPAPKQKPCRAEPRTRAGASSRWQQRAAAPPALPSREPTSWMASSQVSPGSPWHPRTQTTSGIHEPLSGAGAGASGSQSWPRGGSRGGSLLPRPGGDALPPPCLPVVHTPFGLRSLPAGITRGASKPALPAPLLPGVRVPGAGDRAPEFSSPAPPPYSPALLVH